MELRTSILIADRNLPLLAYTLISMPGYTARIRGEAAQFLRCTLVPAQPRYVGTCFRELPVTIDKELMYLQPKTRIITIKETEIACDLLTTAMYRIRNRWYVLKPEVEEFTTVPRIIQPASLP